MQNKVTTSYPAKIYTKSLGFELAKNLYYSKCELYFNTIKIRK